MTQERYAGLSILDIIPAAIKISTTPPPSFKEIGFKPALAPASNLWYGEFEVGGHPYIISLAEIQNVGGEPAWATGFVDKETMSQGVTGLAGHKALQVFNTFAQALLHALDKLGIDRWFFQGDISRQGLYSKLLERAVKTNPKLSREWELESETTGKVPDYIGEAGTWIIRRKESSED